MIKNIIDKLKGICRKGDNLRQVAPNTCNTAVVPTLNTIGRYTRRKNDD